MKYLTLFTIGPVQSFIAQARKLQDLYAGSFLLSYLSRQTMLMAQNQTQIPVQAVILFPDPNQDSAPNRFLMTVAAEDSAGLKQFCVFLEQYVRRLWIEIATKVFEKTYLSYSPAVAAQIESLIQVYYASEEYHGGSEFGECYRKVNKRLGAAKALRGFVQLNEPFGRKCNLMHEYNALFFRGKSSTPAADGTQATAVRGFSMPPQKPRYLVADAQRVTERNVHDLDKYIKEKETLGGVAFVKRCLKDGIPGFCDRFPSVTDIYEMYGRKYDPEDDRHGYYAIVMFDGDDMGRWYSRPDRKGVDPSALEAFQAYLSDKISQFADESCRKVVDWKANKNGAVIYAGGEDFLGALNIKSVFSALRELREIFNRIDLSAYTDKKLTFSAGVVIAHVKTPLSVVRKLAHEAEDKAKKYPNKDAFCLSIAKRSGETSDFVQPFYYGEKSSLTTLDRLVEGLLTEGLSVKFIYQLGREFGRIAETGDAALHREIFLAEAKRLLEHSAFEDKGKGGEIVKEVVTLLTELLDTGGMTLDYLLIYLRAAAFIARERGAAL